MICKTDIKEILEILKEKLEEEEVYGGTAKRTLEYMDKSLNTLALDQLKEYYPNECGSCEFWDQHIPEGTCSQKVKLDMGKFDYQFTLADFGCKSYEPETTLQQIKGE